MKSFVLPAHPPTRSLVRSLEASPAPTRRLSPTSLVHGNINSREFESSCHRLSGTDKIRGAGVCVPVSNFAAKPADAHGGCIVASTISSRETISGVCAYFVFPAWCRDARPMTKADASGGKHRYVQDEQSSESVGGERGRARCVSTSLKAGWKSSLTLWPRKRSRL